MSSAHGRTDRVGWTGDDNLALIRLGYQLKYRSPHGFCLELMALKTATLVSSESMDLEVERNKGLDMGATMLISGIGMGLRAT